LVSDVVVAGEGRDVIAVMLLLNEGACVAFLGYEIWKKREGNSSALAPKLHAHLQALLQKYNQEETRPSNRVSRFCVLEEAPSSAHGEITDKGYLNQRRILARRDEIVQALFADGRQDV
jgi:feruloyl-CoA synthase